MKSGIYSITNKVNGRRYIGSAVHFSQRWHMHRYHLRRNCHQNSHLQRAWNKYGEDVFVFTRLEKVPAEDLLQVEQEWLDRCWSEGLYNKRRDAANNLGCGHTEEERKRISDRMKREWVENREVKMAAAKKTADANRGRTHSDEHKSKISESLREAYRAGRRAASQPSAALNSPEAQARAADSRAGDFIVTTPDGAEIVIHNLNEFARQNGLSQPNLTAVAKGRRRQHKGYRVRPVSESKTTDASASDGNSLCRSHPTRHSARCGLERGVKRE
jgi:group I intron endonuclease